MGQRLTIPSCNPEVHVSPPTSPLYLPFHVRCAAELLSAVVENKEDVVLKLLDRGVPVNVCDYDKRTALHIAAAEGNSRMLNLLLSKNADAKATDRWGRTPLDEAISCGDHVSKEFLRQASGSEGETPEGNYVPAHVQSRSPGLSPDLKVLMNCKSADSDTDDELEHPLARLRRTSQVECWSVPAEEVEMGTKLSSTLKSEVYHAMWRGTKVVAKKIRKFPRPAGGVGPEPEDSAGKRDLLEILNEIELISTLRHPDLVLFLGACLDTEPPFFITEYMAGGDLDKYYMSQAAKLGQPYRPPWATFLKWARAVARALTFLHGCSCPIIHRDLKPMNLLLNAMQDLKVTDFGISKMMKPKKHKLVGTTQTEPAPFMSGGIGTWRYMAPEVVRYEQYTDRVDIYSFALIMWFMYTGNSPFVAEFGKDAELVLKAYLKHEKPRPQLSSKFKPDVARLIKDSWQETATMRPSAYECSQRLAQLS